MSSFTDSAEYPVGIHSISPGSESAWGRGPALGSANIRLGDAVAAAIEGSVMERVSRARVLML